MNKGKINKEKIKSILAQISKDFTITKKQFGDGYFLFDFGRNSVCHFYIKELSDWKFGIWLTENDVDLFGELKELLDKFKPSATSICHTKVKDFIQTLKAIKGNKDTYRALALYGYSCLDNNSDYITSEQVKKELELQNQYLQDLEKQNKQDKEFAFNTFQELANDLDDCVICVTDGWSDGWRSYPRYTITVYINEDDLMDYIFYAEYVDDDATSIELMDDYVEKLIEDKKQEYEKQRQKFRDYDYPRFSNEYEITFNRIVTSVERVMNCDYYFYKGKKKIKHRNRIVKKMKKEGFVYYQKQGYEKEVIKDYYYLDNVKIRHIGNGDFFAYNWKDKRLQATSFDNNKNRKELIALLTT